MPRFTLNETEFVHDDDVKELPFDDNEKFQDDISKNSRRRVSFK